MKGQHEYKPTSKTNVSYCKHCGCLSYKNLPCVSSPCDNNKSSIDPLSLKYQPISLKPNYNSVYHRNYLSNRKIGIIKIKKLVDNYGFDKLISFKAIGLMDQIYLNNEIDIINIDKIASICVLISIQFNECCTKKKNNSKKPDIPEKNFKGLLEQIRKEIKDLNYWEILCLKSLNYDLDKFTSYDYLNLFFKLGIIFSNENIDISNEQKKCIFILDLITNDSRICNYSHYTLALSIIHLVFQDNSYFNDKILKNVYGINLNKDKYIFCKSKIIIILSELYNTILNKIKEGNNIFANYDFLKIFTNIFDSNLSKNINTFVDNSNYSVNIDSYKKVVAYNNNFRINYADM